MAELSVKVPIKFSEKAQRDLYETCMAYKKLAEMRGAENERLRELCSALYEFAYDEYPDSAELNFADRIRELGIEVDG